MNGSREPQRSRWGLLLGCAFSVLLCTCSDEPTYPVIPVTVLNPETTELRLTIDLIDSATAEADSLLVEALLFAGVVDGRLRRVRNDTLHVAGHPMTSVVLSNRQGLLYTGRFRAEGSTFTEVVDVIPPQVAGVTPPPLVRWGGIGKLGPDTLVMEPGEDLVFRLRFPQEPFSPELQSVEWDLDVWNSRVPGGARITGLTFPRAEIRIPSELLKDVPPGESQAEFWFHARHEFPVESGWGVVVPPSGTYLLMPQLGVRLRWIVIKEASGSE